MISISFDRELIVCPISGCIFKDPVTLPEDGQTYEKSEIVKWLQIHRVSPLTRVPINTRVNTIHSNTVMRQLVDAYLTAHPEEARTQFTTPFLDSDTFALFNLKSDPNEQIQYVRERWPTNIPNELLCLVCHSKTLITYSTTFIKAVFEMKGVHWDELTPGEGLYPIHILGQYSTSELIQHAIHCGADINQVDNAGRSIIHHLVVRADPSTFDLVQELVKKGFDIDSVLPNGRRLIHYAGSPEMASLLIRLGADVHSVDAQGRTLFHLVCLYSGSDQVYDMIEPLIWRTPYITPYIKYK